MSTMPTTRPPQPQADEATAVLGISLAETSIMTRAAQRLLHQAGADAHTDGATMAAITTQIATLREPHPAARVGDHDYTTSNDTHWCTEQ